MFVSRTGTIANVRVVWVGGVRLAIKGVPGVRERFRACGIVGFFSTLKIVVTLSLLACTGGGESTWGVAFVFSHLIRPFPFPSCLIAILPGPSKIA